MKVLAFVFLLGAASLNAQVSPPTSNPGAEDLRSRAGKVEGKVVNSVNGMPVPHVTVTLRAVNSARAYKYVVTSGIAGVFLFDLVEPGRYELSAEKVGFFQGSYGARREGGNGTPLTVSEGQSVKGLVFKITPQAVISGRVTDEFGEPMERVSVLAKRLGFRHGKRDLLVVRGAATNDLGEYRLANLGPGSYYVMARRASLSRLGIRISHADVPSKPMAQTPEEDYVDTYYPESPGPDGAMEVQIQAGSEMIDVDITFQKTRVFRVRGQVVDASGQPVAEVRVALTTSNTGGLLGMSGLGGPHVENGKFEVPGVIPGTYHLVAEVTRKGQTLYARQLVSVGDRNITDIVIRIPDPIDVAGRVQVAGLDAPNPPSESFRMEGIKIALFPAVGFGVGSIPEATPQANGSFVLRGVVPDKYRIAIPGKPPEWYVKSILMGGYECEGGIVDLTSGGTVEVVLAMGVAEVSGSVVDADDKPAPGVTVCLVPKGRSRESRNELYRKAQTDQKGQFLLKNVVPGDYDISGWQELEPEAIYESEFRRLFENKVTPLTVNESGRATVQLKGISAEDIAMAIGSPP